MVIANFPIVYKGSNFFYWDNLDITIENLMKHAQKYHKKGIEGQTLVVIDEAQCLFNCRDWGTNSKLRMDWIKFFSQHRHLGFNFILIAQFDRMIDRQIRCLFEYEILHRKLNSFFTFLPVTFFMCIEKWYGANMKVGHIVLRYRKKISRLYDSYALFAFDDVAKYEAGSSVGSVADGGRGTP